MASKNAESAARRAGLEWRAVVARCQNGGGPARLWAAIDARRAGHGYLWPVWSCAANGRSRIRNSLNQSRVAICRRFACGIREIGGLFLRGPGKQFKIG
jgi:hypothetical protein